MEIADALSRLSPEETGEVKGMDVQLLEICPQFSNDMIKRIKEASPNNDDITKRLEYRQERQRHYHDRGCKSLPDLAPGQPIRIQDPVSSTWKPAMVKEKPDKVPRSYTVTTPAGQEFTA